MKTEKMNIKVKITDFFFFIAYSSFIIWSYNNITAMSDFLPDVLFKLLSVIIIMFAVISIYKKSSTLSFFCATLVCITIGITLWFTTSNSTILLILLLLIASYKVNFDSICKVTLITNMIMFSITIILCLLKKIPDYLYVSANRVDSLGNMITAHSYGFLHYSSASFIILFVSIVYIYLIREKIKVWSVILVGCINYLSYIFFTTRMPFFVCVVSLVLILGVKFKILNVEKKKWLFVGTMIPILFTIISFMLVYFYNTSENEMWNQININVFNDRLHQAAHAIEMYSIKPFGQKIVTYGSYMIRYGGVDISFDDYIFVDNGYIFSFIQYGVIFTLFTLFVYIKTLRYASQSNNAIVYIWTIALLLFALFNNSFFTIEYNPCLIMGANVLFQDINNISKKKRGQNGVHNI